MTAIDAIALYRSEKAAWLARTEPERKRVAAVVREILTRGGDGLAPITVGNNGAAAASYYQQNKARMVAMAKSRESGRRKAVSARKSLRDKAG